MATVLRLKNENGNSSIIGWGKYQGRSVQWILDNDPAYLRFLYFNMRNAHLKKDVCEALNLDPSITFHKRKSHYGVKYKFDEKRKKVLPSATTET